MLVALFAIFTAIMLHYIDFTYFGRPTYITLSDEKSVIDDLPSFKTVQLTISDNISAEADQPDSTGIVNTGLIVRHGAQSSLAFSEQMSDLLTWSVTDSILKISIDNHGGTRTAMLYNPTIEICMPNIESIVLTSDRKQEMTMSISGFDADSMHISSVSDIYTRHCNIHALSIDYIGSLKSSFTDSRIDILDARGNSDFDISTSQAVIDTFNWFTTDNITYTMRIYQANVNHFNWLPQADDALLQFKTSRKASISFSQQ